LTTISSSYHVAFDVYYYEDHAIIGYVLFENEQSATPYKSGQIKHSGILPYESGKFYKRELPCLLTALDHIEEPISLIYIDAKFGWIEIKRD